MKNIKNWLALSLCFGLLTLIPIVQAGCGDGNQPSETMSDTVSSSANPLSETSAGTVVTPTSDSGNDGTSWNAASIQEAEQITGYDIYTPTYVPTDFALGSKIMISQIGFGENGYKMVTRLWLWRGTRDVGFQLIQSQKYLEVTGDSQPIDINGNSGQRIFRSESSGQPAAVILSWEQGGFFFTMSGSLTDTFDEQELLKVAASLDHIN